MTPFRQKIILDNVGSDILAVKRVFRLLPESKEHLNGLLMNTVDGEKFVELLGRVQHAHRLKEDGIYGPSSHEVIAPHFDRYGIWLYKRAAIRLSGSYVDPFHLANKVNGRVDQGIDFHGRGPICAIGDCKIMGVGGGGWPGGVYIEYQLLNGRHSGKRIYVAEAVNSLVRAGQKIRAGQPICFFRSDAAPGMYPGIETGWASSILNLTYAAVTTGYHEQPTTAGLCFARFLHNIGVKGLTLMDNLEFP